MDGSVHRLDGLVYWGLTPQQQPGSYQGGENEGGEIRSTWMDLVCILPVCIVKIYTIYMGRIICFHG